MNSVNFETRLFNFFLCPKKTQTSFVPRQWKKLSFFSWELFLCESNNISVFEALEGITYVFIGNIFNIDPVNYIKSEGHYVGFEFNNQTQSIKIFRNSNSHIAIYYHSSESGSLFWGDFEWARLNLQVPWLIDTNSTEELFNTGLISQGRTLYKHIYQFRFQSILDIKNDQLYFSKENTLLIDDTLLRSSKVLFDFIIFRIQTWIQYSQHKSFALSGGADSRLIFAALSSLKSKTSTPVHSRLHPLLSEETDADFAIAKELSQKLEISHLTQKATSMPSAYLSQEPPAMPPIFSSLYGGEYLGGEILNLISSPMSFSQCVVRTAETFTCDFYSGAWFPIYAHHNLTLTPFWDSYLVQVFLQLPDEIVKNYRLYNDLLSQLPKSLQQIPFQSMITNYFPQWRKPSTPLKDPKSLPLESFLVNPATYDFISEKIDRRNPLFDVRLRTLQNILNSFRELT